MSEDWKVSDKKIKVIVDSKANQKRDMPRVVFPKKMKGSIQWVEF